MTGSALLRRGFVVLVFLALVPPGLAEDSGAQPDAAPASADTDGPGGGRSASEIAAELANPNTTLGSLSFNLDYVDVPTARGFEDAGFNLGEIGFDAAIGNSFSNGLVLVGGVVGTMPTATDDDLGRDQWLLGPERS